MTRDELVEMCFSYGFVSSDEDTDGSYLVVNRQTGRCYQVVPVPEDPPRQMLQVLLGEREPLGLNTYDRIIGYYSEIGNWNKSKLAELADRRAGAANMAAM